MVVQRGAEDQEDFVEARFLEDGDQPDGEDQGREGHDHVGRPHQHRVEPAAVVAGQEPTRQRAWPRRVRRRARPERTRARVEQRESRSRPRTSVPSAWCGPGGGRGRLGTGRHVPRVGGRQHRASAEARTKRPTRARPATNRDGGATGVPADWARRSGRPPSGRHRRRASGVSGEGRSPRRAHQGLVGRPRPRVDDQVARSTRRLPTTYTRQRRAPLHHDGGPLATAATSIRPSPGQAQPSRQGGADEEVGQADADHGHDWNQGVSGARACRAPSPRQALARAVWM